MNALTSDSGRYLVGKYGAAPDTVIHQRTVALRETSQAIKRIAELTGFSKSRGRRIWAMHQASVNIPAMRRVMPVTLSKFMIVYIFYQENSLVSYEYTGVGDE